MGFLGTASRPGPNGVNQHRGKQTYVRGTETTEAHKLSATNTTPSTIASHRQPSQPPQASTQQQPSRRHDQRVHEAPHRRHRRTKHAPGPGAVGAGHPNVLTRMWTGACGFTSLKARHWSSSWTISAGISFRMILATGGAPRTRHHASRPRQQGEQQRGGKHAPSSKRHASSPTAANHPRAGGGGGWRGMTVATHHAPKGGPSADGNAEGNAALKRGR